MHSGFVRASELYDVESRTPIAHSAHQATDADVRHALADKEIRSDGGQPSSGTEHSREIKEVRDGKELHPRHTRGTGVCYATPPSHCLQRYYRTYQKKLFSRYRRVNRHHILAVGCRDVTNHRSLQTVTDRSSAESEDSTRNGGDKR